MFLTWICWLSVGHHKVCLSYWVSDNFPLHCSINNVLLGNIVCSFIMFSQFSLFAIYHLIIYLSSWFWRLNPFLFHVRHTLLCQIMLPNHNILWKIINPVLHTQEIFKCFKLLNFSIFLILVFDSVSFVYATCARLCSKICSGSHTY